MPGNPVPNAPATQSVSALNQSKSSLVRSKSLRLSSSKPKLDSGTSTLTRHGSIRVPRTQTTTTAASKPPFSVFRKPALKPKPAFCSSKSSENLENPVKPKTVCEVDKKPCFSPTKHPHPDSKGGIVSDSHCTPTSESPTSLYSDKSHSQDANSWCNSDLVSHLKRLTEEHEKLQVEHARLRMQLLENGTFHPVTNLRRDQQHLSQSDSHLASIPENSSDGSPSSDNGHHPSQGHETLLQNYRIEVLKLQEENRKLQKKFWEQVLNSELVEDEPSNGASQQIVDLIDKLDDKEKELVEANGKVQELENHLAGINLELQQCQDALEDQQHRLEDVLAQRDNFGRQLQDCQAALIECRENIDFLQTERGAIAEAYQETEMSLQATKAEMLIDKSKASELMDRARKLYAKVKDKNLQIQLLHTELDRTQGNCRDMLLSQGAELTMISMHLSQMAMNVHTMLTAAAEFAATELSLQKEMLEDIMADLDSEGERSESPPKENGIVKPDTQINDSDELPQIDSASSEKFLDTHKSLPDIFAYEPASPLYSSASSESERHSSLVQSMVRAYEQSARSDSKSAKPLPSKSTSEQNSEKSSIENLSSLNGDNSHISSPSKDNSPVTSGVFKPVGMATAFRPVRQRSEECEVQLIENLNFEEEKKTSLEMQLNQMDCLVKKVGKVIEIMQGKVSAKIKLLNEEKVTLQEEARSWKNKLYKLQSELNNRDYLVEKANGKSEELAEQLKKTKQSFIEEKEALLQKNLALTEQNKCLEAVNEELSNQLKNDLQQIVKSAAGSNSEYLSNALTICDKLNLKKEIAKLKATVAQKESHLQELAQKLAKATLTFEKDLKKSAQDIQVLDSIVEKVFTTLESNPEIVEKNEVLQSLLSLVSGNCTLTNLV